MSLGTFKESGFFILVIQVPFVLINIPAQRAAIFLSNRTYYKDERAQWIKDRDVLIEIMKKELIRETVE